jgi:hypothetical protein
MSNARNIARLQPTTAGQITATGLQDASVSAAKLADSIITRNKLGFSGGVLQTMSARYNTQISMSSGTMYDLNCTITITPTTNNSKFLLMGYGHADDTSSTSWGIGLAVMCEASGYSNRYFSHQGSHHNYVSGANDHYFHASLWELDDGSGHEGGGIPVVAGVARTYRLYGCSHNDSCRWNANNISQNAATMSRSPGSNNVYGTRFIVMEISA